MPERPVNSTKQPSLDEIVSQSAVVIAEQIQHAAAWAKSEMDLQIEVAGALKQFARDVARQTKINPLEGHHNVTIATGRPDSVYGSVIIEYKDPGTLSPKKDAGPNRAVIEQLKRRFSDMNREEHRNWNSMFGVGTDGKYFVFLRLRREKWTDEEPLPVNRYSTERFLWALYNLGQKGKPYLPEYLHGDFGSDSPVAQEGVRALYEEILATENPKAQVFFNQWKILFGEVCGYDVENLSDKLKKLAESYEVKGKPQPAPLLFAVHTYYAILIKLLAAEVVSFFNPWMPRQVEKLQSAISPAKLKRELEELESGGIFHQMGITNFLEGDLFSWYLAVWSEPIQALVRKMISKLDEYNPGTFSEEPAQSRDLLKKLYQQLFPKSVRHDLGEYYTPDWLAEHVLNELGYEGDPDKRLLDPACGSGTFLVMAINRIRRWYDANREKCAYDEGELLKKILANVIGFDLNPLAVMAARTNYLVAVKDLIRHVDHVEIPVYLCDSIMTPAEYGDLFSGATLGKVAKVPCSAMKPPHLLVPKEIAQSPKDVAKYADVLETCVKNAYAPAEFLSRCRDEGLNITATDPHLDLYKELVKLDKANKNGIWARIIKNNFAPLFVGRVDYVAGNPPWINWDALPQSYREDTAGIWQKYRLFPHSGMRARLGSAEDDISILMTYVSLDHFVRDAGLLGFVITQTVFHSKGGGQGFRRFSLDKIPVKVECVSDFSSFQPFEGATNKTSAIVLRKGRPTNYPVPYTLWQKREPGPLETSLDWASAEKFLTSTPTLARPIGDPTSPWIVASADLSQVLAKAIGTSPYRARLGIYSSPTGVFWVRIAGDAPSHNVLIENERDSGKQRVARQFTGPVEQEFVWPLARGRDLVRWHCKPSKYVVLAHDPETGDAVDPTRMKREFPKLYAYLRAFEEVLKARKNYQKYFDTSHSPFWAMFNVGTYTFAPFKVAWRYVDSGFRCAVLGKGRDRYLGEKMVIPDGKLVLVPFHDFDEAHYTCAILNSSIVQLVVKNYAVSTQISTHVTEHIRIPQFDTKKPMFHRLSEFSQNCHTATAKGDTKRVAAQEAEIDKAAAKLWGITDDELKTIQEALAETGKSRRAREDEEE